MAYGFVITAKGLGLLAKQVAGEQLEVTRVMVGSGKLEEGQSPSYLTDLLQPVAQATSTLPVAKGNVVSFVVEYRSDLDGGLAKGFWVNEFGVFVRDGDEEILLYYATLGDFPQYVTAYQNGAVDIRRYPVSIIVTDGVEPVLAYPALAFMTAEEIKVYLELYMLPSFLEGAEELITKHNKDSEAHPGLKSLLDADLAARLERLENALFHDIKANPFLVTFDTLEGVVVEKGVWNREKKRLEC